MDHGHADVRLACVRLRACADAASLYALFDAFFAQRAHDRVAGRPIPPRLFRRLRDPINLRGLVDMDAGWAEIETPDPNGFQGFTSVASTDGSCAALSLDPRPRTLDLGPWTLDLGP